MDRSLRNMIGLSAAGMAQPVFMSDARLSPGAESNSRHPGAPAARNDHIRAGFLQALFPKRCEGGGVVCRIGPMLSLGSDKNQGRDTIRCGNRHFKCAGSTILSGILRPTAGKVVIEGRVPFDNRIAHVARIGAVFGQRSQLWWDLPIIDGFDLLRDIYRVEPAAYLRTRDELVAMLRLERLLDQPVQPIERPFVTPQ
jgi:hypothetical protein